MRTLSDLEAAFDVLGRRAEEFYGEHDLDRTIGHSPRRRPAPRRRVALAAAAVVAVSGTGAGASYLWSSGSHAPAADGPAVPMCVGQLPTQWQQAFVARSIRADGQSVSPVQVDASGKVTVQWTIGGTLNVGQVGPDDVVTRIGQLVLPAGHGALSVTVDSRSIVVVLFRLPAASSGGSPSDTDDIAVIDRVTGAVTHVLAGAPVPSGYAFEGHWGNLVGGVFYWGEHPLSGTAPDLLMSYQPSSGSYAVKASGTHLNQNAIGYFWDGGSFPLTRVPPVHPVLGDEYQTVTTDGSTFAWSTYADPTTLYWSDDSGAARTFSQRLMRQLSVDGVSGPYVFLSYGEGADTDKVSGNEHILDTRTGALVDTGLPIGSFRDLSGAGVVAYDSLEKEATTQVIDLNGLPQLTCPSS